MRIFWDWDRTLGTKPFWSKLAAEDSGFAKHLDNVFASAMIGDWMRGRANFDDIHEVFLQGYDKNYLRRRLVEDWPVSDVFHEDLWNHYTSLYPGATHYIVTDNMDVFDDFVNANQSIFARFGKVYNPSSYGVLKSDHEGLLYAVMQEMGLTSFDGDLLLDDSLENCETFKSLGGSAIVVDKAR